jgi:hypothetical protein
MIKYKINGKTNKRYNDKMLGIVQVGSLEACVMLNSGFVGYLVEKKPL